MSGNLSFRNMFYILQDKKPVPVNDIREWVSKSSGVDRGVVLTRIGKIKISTVFLGINHSFGENRKPILFETMVLVER